MHPPLFYSPVLLPPFTSFSLCQLSICASLSSSSFLTSKCAVSARLLHFHIIFSSFLNHLRQSLIFVSLPLILILFPFWILFYCVLSLSSCFISIFMMFSSPSFEFCYKSYIISLIIILIPYYSTFFPRFGFSLSISPFRIYSTVFLPLH